MQMKKVFLSASVCILIMLSYGCMSVSYHIDQSDRDNVYIGTKSVVAFFRYPFIDEDEKDRLSDVFWPWAFPFFLVDLPLSAVSDTLLYPYDLLSRPEEANNFNSADGAD